MTTPKFLLNFCCFFLFTVVLSSPAQTGVSAANGGPTLLAAIATRAPTSNDRSETIAVPNMATPYAQLKMEGAGNNFFDINYVNFTIAAPISDGGITVRGRVLRCDGASGVKDVSVFMFGRDIQLRGPRDLTGPEGYYEIKKVPPGNYVIGATASKGPFKFATKPITLEGKGVVDLDIKAVCECCGCCNCS